MSTTLQRKKKRPERVYPDTNTKADENLFLAHKKTRGACRRTGSQGKWGPRENAGDDLAEEGTMRGRSREQNEKKIEHLSLEPEEGLEGHMT